MRCSFALVVALAVAGVCPGQVAPPVGQELFGILYAGNAAGGTTSTTAFWSEGRPESKAIALGTMVTLGSNPYTSAWTQLSLPAATPPAAPADTTSAMPVVNLSGGSLVLYGGQLPAVSDFLGSTDAPSTRFPNAGQGGNQGGSAPAGVPIITTRTTPPTADMPGEVSFELRDERGLIASGGTSIPPGGWFALTLGTSEMSLPIWDAPLDPIFPGDPILPGDSTPPGDPDVIRELVPGAGAPPPPVPEPTTLALAGAGLLGVLGRRIVRRSR